MLEISDIESGGFVLSMWRKQRRGSAASFTYYAKSRFSHCAAILSLQQPLSSTNFLYELDRITKDILDVIMEGQKMSVPGDLVGVPGATEKVSFHYAKMFGKALHFIVFPQFVIKSVLGDTRSGMPRCLAKPHILFGFLYSFNKFNNMSIHVRSSFHFYQ